MMTMRQQLRRIADRVRSAIREWSGQAEYERLAHACRAHGDDPPDRGRYFAQRLEQKYSRSSRCC